MISKRTKEQVEQVLVFDWWEKDCIELWDGFVVPYEERLELLDDLLTRLERIDGNKSFKDSMRMLHKSIETRQELAR